ncbi:hypothetical protein IL306_005186 [Fusarium sp. DS 682]|nr:hypothetical protein IL306_005186 [Fusarium sp. DS 682]
MSEQPYARVDNTGSVKTIDFLKPDDNGVLSIDYSEDGPGYSHFRIVTEETVKLILIKDSALKHGVSGKPEEPDLHWEDILPIIPLNKNQCNAVMIERNATTGTLDAQSTRILIPSVETVWHPTRVDVVDLRRLEQIACTAQQCFLKPGYQVNGLPQTVMIGKIARWPWDIQWIEAETKVYQFLQSSGSGIAPRFLGHVTEDDHVNGFLLEKVEGRPAGIADLQICQRALHRLHELRILHGDIDRTNIIVRPDNTVAFVDFEKAKMFADGETLMREMAALPAILAEGPQE